MSSRSFIIILTGLLSLSTPLVFAQTCSCGGVPLLSSIEQLPQNRGVVEIQVTYEHHSIEDLVSGRSTLRDNSHSQVVDAFILNIGYSFSSRVSLSVSLGSIVQERSVTGFNNQSDIVRVSGVADGSIILNYLPVSPSPGSRSTFGVGVGIKFPSGSDNLTADGILLAGDLQPGTGAWDGIIRLYTKQNLDTKILSGLVLTGTYSLKGNNKRFGKSNENYRFGNEIILAGGIEYFPIPNLIVFPGIRYRQIEPSSFNSHNLPNSGGSWLNLVPDITLNINKNISIGMNGQIPLWRNLEGTQLTTTYSLGARFIYRWNILES